MFWVRLGKETEINVASKCLGLFLAPSLGILRMMAGCPKITNPSNDGGGYESFWTGFFLSEQCANKRNNESAKQHLNSKSCTFILTKLLVDLDLFRPIERVAAARKQAALSSLSLSSLTRRRLQTQVVPQLAVCAASRDFFLRSIRPCMWTPGLRDVHAHTCMLMHIRSPPGEWPHIILIQKLRLPSFCFTHMHIPRYIHYIRT